MALSSGSFCATIIQMKPLSVAIDNHNVKKTKKQ